MHLTDPTFPPLLTGLAVSAPQRVVDVACRGADAGALEAGHVVWARNTTVAELAFVFEPDVPRAAADDMRIVVQTAIADGLGAIMPSQTAIQFRWPDAIVVNGAQVGETLLVSAAREADGVPAWLVVAARLVLTRTLDDLEPGRVREESSIAEEDGADLDRSRVVSTIASHTMNAVHGWGETGTRPFADRWIGRLTGFGAADTFTAANGAEIVAAPIGASGGGALIVKTQDGQVETLQAPSRAWDVQAGGIAAIIGAPWL